MRIVPARDGGLARLRLAGGVLSTDAARAVARAATRCGSGAIEVTNRANLQLRGIRDDAHAELISIALDAGLGPSSEGGDDLRNIMLSPLASDATRALAARIVEAMQRDAALHALSPKFALQLDAGETLAMLDHPHDVWLAALDADAAHFAFGFAGAMPHRAHDAPALGVIAREDIVRFVMSALRAFVALASDDEHRMRDLLARIDIARVLDTLDVPFTQASPTWRRATCDASLRLGAHREDNGATHYVGAQTQLGRLDASTLDALAELASTHAQGRLLMTPWQSVMIPGVDSGHVQHVLHALSALGLATDRREPFARIVACAGSSGCAKSRADTKADAHRLASILPSDVDVHLSGCGRSCAAAHPVDTTLLAVAPGRYDLYRHARLEARDLTMEEAAAWLARSTAHA
ncbi:Cobalamin biosynthesis protein CobG [Candidatus Burkholderia verschuerenii]|uniref:Cobalamin biosynthesis protein CobG n=2 Tax=Candidatus Burkholderia verschuerenii TaxID=242163 RepID=A0A0L0MBH6_9BURK|nr:Cobalamin biosynthesis protein CobG [Candidatus Burkholderia verschuerenii]